MPKETKLDRTIRIVSNKYNLDADEVRLFCRTRKEEISSYYYNSKDCVDIANRVFWLICQYRRERNQHNISTKEEVTPNANYRKKRIPSSTKEYIDSLFDDNDLVL